MLSYDIISRIIQDADDFFVEIGLHSGKRYNGRFLKDFNKWTGGVCYLLIEDDFEAEDNTFSLIDGYELVCINLSSIEYVRYNVKDIKKEEKLC